MNAYLQWNDALAIRFFNNEMAGRSVYLYVTQKLIATMEQELEPEAGQFLAAILAGPPWVTHQGTCQRALQAYLDWRDRNLPFPPYIAYLGLFVLAGSTDGDFAVNAYYPRLRKLLDPDDPKKGTVPSFNHMWQLWEDLETWSVRDRIGEVGIFQAYSTGGNVHIGFPLAQTMLTEQERKALPQVFYKEGLDPTSPPPADELARALRSPTAKSFLRPRTIRLVENQRGEDLYTLLLDTVANELEEWDGEAEVEDSSGNGLKLVSARLRICLNLDLVAGRAKTAIRCKLNREFPEKGLQLSVPNFDGRLRAEEYLDGWSLPLSNDETGEVFDASRLDWCNSVTMSSDPPKWDLRLHGRRVRIFTKGTEEGLPGLVEVYALPQGQPFYIAYSQSSWLEVDHWLTGECRGFRELGKLSGLPLDWIFASVEEAISDQAIRNVFPFLSFPSRVRLRFVGGIRSGKGNNFFSFAPPSVALHGGTPNIEVYCNGQLMLPAEKGEAMALPHDFLIESRIVMEARSGDSVRSRLSLFLTGNFSLPNSDTGLFLNNIGSCVDVNRNNPSIAGAQARGNLSMPLVQQQEDLEAQIGKVEGFLIGNTPGQIAKLPLEPFPTDWCPIWAVTKKRGKQLKAIFIGESLTAASPIESAISRDRAVQKWKEVLWHWRKRVQPPSSPSLRALWKETQEVAKHV